MQDETFKISRYGKTELACIYYPALTPESAIQKFRRDLKKNPRLRYLVDRSIHELSKPQVRQIIEELDDP